MTYRVCAAVAISLMLLSSLSSCASKHAPAVKDGSEFLSLGMEETEAILIARDRVRLSGVLYLENGSPHPWLLAARDITAASCGSSVPVEKLDIARTDAVPGLVLPAASREGFTFSFECAIPPGDGEDWALDIDAYADLVLEGVVRVTRRATTCVSIPRIKDPVFTIEKVRVKQAELVNTRLLLDVSIENPNAVTLIFDKMDYTFYGEGRWWAESRRFEPARIPARERMTVKLELIMNFIDMKRSLLDQVIDMAHISYRLTGSAGIRVEREGFPPFEYPFAITGESPVIK